MRTIFAQPDHASAMAHLNEVAAMLRRKFPQAAGLREDAAEDILAFMDFPGSTGASSTRRTRSSAYTKRSRDEQGWWASSLTETHSYGWWQPFSTNKTTNDRWPIVATSVESMKKIGQRLEGGDTPKELLAAIA